MKKKTKNNRSIFNSYYYFKFEGVNIERFLNELIKHGIFVFDIERPSYKLLYFKISPKNYKKLKKINTLKIYNFTLQSKNGVPKLQDYVTARLGVFVAALVCLIAVNILSLFTFSINISGISQISETEVLNVLKLCGVEVNKINNFDNTNVELKLKQQLSKISMVSVSKRGTHVLINIKEKLPETWETYKSIVAENNMLITKMQVYQGLANYKVGDSVKKGAVIVNNYEYTDTGEKISVLPLADIEADVWFCGEVDFNEEEIVTYKTGKKITNSTLLFNNLKIFSTIKPVKFDKFTKLVYNDYIFKNWFLPFKRYSETYYELKEKVVLHNFEKEKNELIAKSKKMAYDSVPEGLNITDEKTEIIELGNGKKLIQTYLKSSIKIETWKGFINGYNLLTKIKI